MSRRNRKQSLLARPLSERRHLVPGEDIPATLEAIVEAVARGDVIDLAVSELDTIFTPEVEARLDAIDPTILDYRSLTSSEAVAYSPQARIVVRTYLDEIQAYYRKFRQETDLGQPIACNLFDLRHEYARKEALDSYPGQAPRISGVYEKSRSVPGTIPAFWHVGPMRHDTPIKPMTGRYPVYVVGPTIVVIQLPIPA
jgi:hypothetical protein